MPASFINRISRSSSGLLTAGPNHHQRIMILASSGGRTNERCKSFTLGVWACPNDPKATMIRIVAQENRRWKRESDDLTIVLAGFFMSFSMELNITLFD